MDDASPRGTLLDIRQIIGDEVNYRRVFTEKRKDCGMLARKKTVREDKALGKVKSRK